MVLYLLAMCQRKLYLVLFHHQITMQQYQIASFSHGFNIGIHSNPPVFFDMAFMDGGLIIGELSLRIDQWIASVEPGNMVLSIQPPLDPCQSRSVLDVLVTDPENRYP